MISCICPTFNRSRTLEESIHSFLIQDYQGDKELIIINDFTKHKLIIDHPEIIVVNSTKDTLGGIINDAIISHSRGDLIAVWEDDDIYLKNSLSTRVKYLNDSGALLINNAYFLDASTNEMKIGNNTFHGQMMFTRQLFDLVDGYPEVWQAHDIKFIQKIPKESIRRIKTLPEEISYIYRWGNGQQNLSSMFSGDDSEATLQRVYNFRNTQINDTEFSKIKLEPKWLINYREMIQQ